VTVIVAPLLGEMLRYVGDGTLQLDATPVATQEMFPPNHHSSCSFVRTNDAEPLALIQPPLGVIEYHCARSGAADVSKRTNAAR
jgi:hypothetical protein